MDSIFKYNNYRQYIRDYYLEKKRTTGYFTYRYFAQRAGFSSPVFIKLVIVGKANLSNKSIEKLCQAMDLPIADCEYFRNLAWFNQAKTAEQKHEFLEKLRNLNQQYSAEVLETDKYDFYSKWYYSVLREIVPNSDLYDDFTRLGALLIPALKKRETKKAIKLLEKLKLLKKQKDGSYRQARKLISTGSEVESLAVRDLHLQMANLAEEAIKNIPKKERDISGLTMGMSRNTCKKIIEELKNFRERMIRIIAEDEDAVDQVYRLNLQFFPLSKRIKGDKEGVDDA